MPDDVSLPPGTGTVLVTSTPSDSHTWNLVFLQLALEEAGYLVRNVGACPPVDVIVDECRLSKPDLVVISSVNGHGLADGIRVVHAIKGEPHIAEIPLVIGGMLTTGGVDPVDVESQLLAAGCAGVFIRPTAMADFAAFLATVTNRVESRAG
jgi:methylaspartate mutase sigma subunit